MSRGDEADWYRDRSDSVEWIAMARRATAILIALGAALLLAAGATARPTVESMTKDGNRSIRTNMDISSSGLVHYFIDVSDPDGVFPYCVTLQFEKKTSVGWRRVGKGSAYSRDCFKTSSDAEDGSETQAFWDALAKPDGKLQDRFKSGDDVRAHGFTDLGGSLTFSF